MGGQSAFGTKAGDLFTRITIIVAAIWVLLSMASLKVLNQYSTTGGLSASEHGQAAPTRKTTDGGLLPSATGKTPEEEPVPGTTPAAPGKSEAAPTAPAADAKPADTTPPVKSDAPADAAK